VSLPDVYICQLWQANELVFYICQLWQANELVFLNLQEEVSRERERKLRYYFFSFGSNLCFAYSCLVTILLN